MKAYRDHYFTESGSRGLQIVGERNFQESTSTRMVIRAEEPLEPWSGSKWGDVKAYLRGELDRLMREEGIEAEPLPHGRD